MKILFWTGLVVLVLGIASLFIPIPHNDKEGISAGDMSFGVNVQHEEKVSPIISGILILGGAGPYDRRYEEITLPDSASIRFKPKCARSPKNNSFQHVIRSYSESVG